MLKSAVAPRLSRDVRSALQREPAQGVGDSPLYLLHFLGRDRAAFRALDEMVQQEFPLPAFSPDRQRLPGQCALHLGSAVSRVAGMGVAEQQVIARKAGDIG